nr:uncharacterized mitochondrial protein AtMg00810-like [Tanacetum cinerariifolium]
YLKGKPYLGLWYPKDSPFDLVAYSDSDYAGASLDRKSTTGGCQFLGCRLISWQCKKQTVVATSSTEAEYVAAASGCAQVLWTQNQFLDYGDSPLLGVNTPRSDEDRLKLMELMVFLLQKDVCNDIGITVARLSSYCCQANVSAVCQWKFLIPTILQSLSAKRTSWNEFSTAMASAMICLSKGVETPLFEGMIADRQPAEEEFRAEQVQVNAAIAAAVVKDVVEDVAEDVAHVATPSPPPHGILSPPQEPSSHPQQPHVTPPAPTQGEAFLATFQQVLDTCSAFLRRVEHLEYDNVAQRLEIVKLKARGRMMNEDEGIELVKDAKIAESEGRQADKQAEIYNIDLYHSSKVLSMQEDDSEVQEVVEVVTIAKLITKVVTAAASQVSAASITIPAAKPSIPAAAPTVVAAYTRRRNGVIIRDPEEELPLKTPAETPKVKDKGKGIMVEAPKPMKKKDQIELDAEYARKLHEEINKDDADFNKDIDWDVAMDHVNQKSSSNPKYIKRYQGMKKRPQTESEARKNMMIYLKNTAGYKMDFFKGMSYAYICPIFQARFDENMRFLFKSIEEIEEEDEEIIKSINETPTQKAAKRRKLNEEAQEAEALKKQLEIIHDEDDDVFTEATPLGRKVPVVDYEIVMINNKPRYPLSKFTLEQLVNVARLQVEEESEMSLTRASIEGNLRICCDNKVWKEISKMTLLRRLQQTLVWQCFEKIEGETRSDRQASCNNCGKVFSAKPGSGTSNLGRHMLRCFEFEEDGPPKNVHL